jgi:hypothetical protein
MMSVSKVEYGNRQAIAGLRVHPPQGDIEQSV